jgi:hypothetical protein
MLGRGICAPGDRRQVNKARWVLTDGEFFPFTLTDADIAEAELRLTKDDGTWYPARVATSRSRRWIIAQFKPATWAEANDTASRSASFRAAVACSAAARTELP